MRTSTIKGVELVSVGTWAASTGVTQITRDDLEAMLAAHADGFVDKGPVKLGHASPLNDALGDGSPAYGWVVPTGIRKNAQGKDTLVGDLVGMPSQLAAIAPTAYRRRSVEIAWDVKTPAGKTYRAVLTGVALLGADAPAVKGLADVLALYTAAPADAGRADVLEVVDGLEDNHVAVAMLSAARNAGAGTAQLDAIAAAAGARDTADVPPPVEDPDNHGPQTSTQTSTQEGRTMTVTDEQIRKALNLAADADVDAEVNRIIAERETTTTDTGAATGGQPTAAAPAAPAQPAAPAAPGAQAPAATPAAPVAAPATPAGQPAAGELVGAGAGAGDGQTVTLSAGTWQAAQETLKWAEERRRQEVLDAAVRSGRIAPAEVSHFAAQLARDEQGTTTLLSQLTPRFPTTEVGDPAAPNASTGDEAYDAFERQVFGDALGRPTA